MSVWLIRSVSFHIEPFCFDCMPETRKVRLRKNSEMSERGAKWSVFDRIKSFPPTPDALMAEISTAISAHEYIYSTALLESATVSSKSEEEKTCGSNKSHAPTQQFSAKMADEAYKAGCAALAAGKLDEALQCLNVALSKCPPEKTSAVAKLQSLISLTSQQLRKSS